MVLKGWIIVVLLGALLRAAQGFVALPQHGLRPPSPMQSRKGPHISSRRSAPCIQTHIRWASLVTAPGGDEGPADDDVMNGGVGRSGTAIDRSMLVKELIPYLAFEDGWMPLGSSRYVTNLRRFLEEAAADRGCPVMVIGEVGTKKVSIGVLLHRLSDPTRTAFPFITTAQQLVRDPARVFGSVAGQGGGLTPAGEGLLDLASANSTVIVSQVETMQPDLLARLYQLAETGVYQSQGKEGPEGPLKRFTGRLLLCSETTTTGLPKRVRVIKISPIRHHKIDLMPEVTQVLERVSRAQSRPLPKLTTAAWVMLNSYDFPENQKEVEVLTELAMARAARRGHADELRDEDFFDPSDDSKRRHLRSNVFEKLPWLRDLVQRFDWPNGLNFGFTRWAFAVVVAALFLGPQDRDHNVFLQVFWSWWWPLIMLTYPLVGRLWCSICPFSIYGQWAQQIRTSAAPAMKLLRWPKAAGEYGPWFMYALFVAILIWEEVWDLPHDASLSSWLLLLITSGAVVTSLVYERRLWCKDLCPIGAMNGLFAKLGVLEVSAEKSICQQCTDFYCLKGGHEKAGCPIYNQPSKPVDMSACVMCLACVSNCNKSNAGLYLRLPGQDVIDMRGKGASWEVALLFLLLGNVFMRRLPQTISFLPTFLGGGAEAAQLLVDDRLTHGLASLACLGLPLILAYVWHALVQLPMLEAADASAAVTATAVSSDEGDDGSSASDASSSGKANPSGRASDFIGLSYGLLPLVWGANTAHYLEYFLREAPGILPVAALTVGVGDQVASWLPHFNVSTDIIAFIQGILLLAGGGASVLLTAAIAKRPLKDIIPQIAMILGIDVLLGVVIEGGAGLPLP